MHVQSDLDRVVAAMAARQHGAVARWQLEDAGLGRMMIEHRVRHGRLHPVHRGVFAVGHRRLSREGRWMAATLACGRRATLNHGDAAVLWELASPRGVLVHVTTPSRSGRHPDPDAIVLHRTGTLADDEVTVWDGIPVTTPSRTLLDLAGVLHPRGLEDAMAQARGLARLDLGELRRLLDVHRRQPGGPALRRLVALLDGSERARTRSRLEDALLRLCAKHGLPAPETNVTLAGLTVDFHWPGTDLVVETDGFAYHSMPGAFENDRDRDQVLALAGFRVVRFTYTQVVRQQRRSAERLAEILAGSGSLHT